MKNLPTRHSLFDELFNEVTPALFMRPLHGDGLPAAGEIKIDVNERDDKFYVYAEIPGVAKEDIDLSVTDNTVTISAEIEQHDEHKEGNKNLRSERYYGSVSRSFQLPSNVNVDKAKASYENGILKLVLPKKNKENRQKLEIK
ncbi:MAG: heat-shock protein Hsp20 [Gammaproteobacteria bacterium]|nr:MAG: heat-shock protein Hsp20 [Gammaproteobacteria bacterium]